MRLYNEPGTRTGHAIGMAQDCPRNERIEAVVVVAGAARAALQEVYGEWKFRASGKVVCLLSSRDVDGNGRLLGG